MFLFAHLTISSYPRSRCFNCYLLRQLYFRFHNLIITLSYQRDNTTSSVYEQHVVRLGFALTKHSSSK